MALPDHAAYNYVVTAHAPSSVRFAVRGAFESADALNLLVCKTTSFALYTVGAEGLEQRGADIPIFGRVVALAKVRLPPTASSSSSSSAAAASNRSKRAGASWPGDGRDAVVFLTERLKICLVSWSGHGGDGGLVTHDMGDMRMRIGRETTCGPRVLVDPRGRMLAVHIYDGLLRIIPLSPITGKFERHFDVKLDELQVIDLVFLHDDGKNADGSDGSAAQAYSSSSSSSSSMLCSAFCSAR